jgi:hypothetical protein
VSDHVFRIDDFDVVRKFDITARTAPSPSLASFRLTDIAVVQLEDDTLEVEKDVDDIFLHAINGGVLVEHAVDADFGRCITRPSKTAECDAAHCQGYGHSRVQTAP